MIKWKYCPTNLFIYQNNNLGHPYINSLLKYASFHIKLRSEMHNIYYKNNFKVLKYFFFLKKNITHNILFISLLSLLFIATTIY